MVHLRTTTTRQGRVTSEPASWYTCTPPPIGRDAFHAPWYRAQSSRAALPHTSHTRVRDGRRTSTRMRIAMSLPRLDEIPADGMPWLRRPKPRLAKTPPYGMPHLRQDHRTSLHSLAGTGPLTCSTVPPAGHPLSPPFWEIR